MGKAPNLLVERTPVCIARGALPADTVLQTIKPIRNRIVRYEAGKRVPE